MNALAFHRPPTAVPHRFSVDEVQRMTEIGVLHPDAPVELIDGVLYDMASEGAAHISCKGQLLTWFAQNKPADIWIAADSTLHLARDEAPEPDLYLYEAGAQLQYGPQQAQAADRGGR